MYFSEQLLYVVGKVGLSGINLQNVALAASSTYLPLDQEPSTGTSLTASLYISFRHSVLNRKTGVKGPIGP